MTEINKEMNQYVDQWLRDAHAMEKQAETILKGQTGRIKNYPELSARLEAHLDETTRQRERLEACIERRGTSSSAMKDASARFTAMMQNFSGMFAGDEVVKGVLASYSFEHMEIASYRILAAAADTVGDTRTAQTCREICLEEEAMADWLKGHMDSITAQYLHAVARDEEAKR